LSAPFVVDAWTVPVLFLVSRGQSNDDISGDVMRGRLRKPTRTSALDYVNRLYYSETQRRSIMTVSRMVQARVPGDIQDIANQVIQASGLTVSDVVRVLMTRIAQDKIIPPGLFQPNEETLAAFAEVERGGLKRFDSVDDLFADLHAKD
jgi:DNA-damage-inducible protein J